MGTLTLRGVRKTFGGVHALKGVDLELKSGEIHALVGENGAGKSTLIKIAGGVFPPDEGRIEIDGKPVSFASPRDAQQHGIVVIHQTPLLCPHLSVTENILLGHLPTRWGIVQWRQATKRAAELLQQLNASLPLDAPVGTLSVAQQQLVALARALSLQARWLILDEPTASLSRTEVERLFAILQQLKEQDVGILFVSHRLEEVLELSDRITVLRDGEKVATLPTKTATREQLIALMVGSPVAGDEGHGTGDEGEKMGKSAVRQVDRWGDGKTEGQGESLLRLCDVSVNGFVQGVSLTVRQGEIVGLFGLVGSGRSELAQAIVGLRNIVGGIVEWQGQLVRFRSPNDALRHGIAYLPEDRLRQSLLLPRSIRENIGLPNLSRFSRKGVVNERAEREAAEQQTQTLRVRMTTVEQPVQQLSGGNQQKVALAKWLLTNPQLFILDEPTHGVDVATKAEIHRLIAEWRQKGKTILLISSELEELQRLCDRIVVMRQGHIVGEFLPTAAPAEILAAAFGQADGTGDKEEAGRQVGSWAGRESEEVEKQGKGAMEQQGTRKARRAPRTFFHLSREVSLLLFILTLALFVGWRNPAFLTGEHWLTLLQESAPTLIGAVAIAMVILSGNLDLSVGSLLGACAMAAGHAAKGEWALPLVILLALGLGAAVGAVNGLLVTRFSLPAIIVTLGMMGIIRGTMLVLTKGYWVIGLPESFRWLGVGKIAGVPVPVWIALFVLALCWFVSHYTCWGRDLYAIGNNAEAARLAGILVARRVFSVFVFCSALVGLAALVYTARFPVVQSETGKGFELDVITAAVFGGVNIFGGAGSVVGAALGAFAVTVLHSALTFLQLAGEWDKFALGGLILLSVTIDALRQRRRS